MAKNNNIEKCVDLITEEIGRYVKLEKGINDSTEVLAQKYRKEGLVIAREKLLQFWFENC